VPTLLTDKPLRRSARLAELNFRQEIVRQEQTFSAVEPQTEDILFTMQLAIQPPKRVAVGVAFRIPIVVTFAANDAIRDRDPSLDTVSKFSGVWAFLSLMSEDKRQSLAPPNTDLLQGHVADSIHPLMKQQVGDSQTIGYASFRNLVVTKPGRYCFRVTIIDMNMK
jgi:hypothetical protein